MRRLPRTTGSARIDAVEKHRPDVVLLDIGLPKLNGHEVCRRDPRATVGQGHRAHRADGLGPKEDRRKSQEAGFDGHLVKPVITRRSSNC